MTDLDPPDHIADPTSEWGRSRDSRVLWLPLLAAPPPLRTQAASRLLRRREPEDGVRDGTDRAPNDGHIARALLRGARP